MTKSLAGPVSASAPGHGVTWGGPPRAAGCEAGPAENLDSYGHGTHHAGAIPGRDGDTPSTVQTGTTSSFPGMAPDTRIVGCRSRGLML